MNVTNITSPAVHVNNISGEVYKMNNGSFLADGRIVNVTDVSEYVWAKYQNKIMVALVAQFPEGVQIEYLNGTMTRAYGNECHVKVGGVLYHLPF